MMSDDDNDDQMIFGDLGGLKLPDICLIGEEKPRKNLTMETCPNWGSNSGLLLDRHACYHLVHSGGLKRFIGTDTASVELFFQHIHLRNWDMSFRGTNFFILGHRSLPPGIGITVWHCHSENADADQTEISNYCHHFLSSPYIDFIFLIFYIVF